MAESPQHPREIPGKADLPYLRGWRVKRGYSVRKLAELAGVSPNTVHTVEKGAAEAQAATIVKLAKALGIRWWVLLEVSADDIEDRRGAA